jgi:murein L,D-transpeptidase YafK
MSASWAIDSARTKPLRFRLLLATGAAAVAAACVSTGPGSGPARTRTSSYPGLARVQVARQRQAGALRALFARARVELPARLLLVGFKDERRLELWGYSHHRGRLVLVAAYPWLATSGVLGPKRRSWDHQVPEGFYRVAALNPMSLYHLSLRLDYPNASDRLLGDPSDPGGDIFIHGDHVSDGCIAVGDRAIEQLYLAVLDSRESGNEVPVDIFPCRFSDAGCRAVLRREAAGRPQLAAFWENLAEGFARFESSGQPPRAWVSQSGRYVFSPRGGESVANGRPNPSPNR